MFFSFFLFKTSLLFLEYLHFMFAYSTVVHNNIYIYKSIDLNRVQHWAVPGSLGVMSTGCGLGGCCALVQGKQVGITSIGLAASMCNTYATMRFGF